MVSLSLNNVKKRFGKTEVLHGINLEINTGEFVVFVGPSGCGKSTLLRLIAGLESISEGELRIGDGRVNDLSPRERGIAMVFQSYALYPHMSVYRNMAFGLRIDGDRRDEIDRKIRATAAKLHLEPLLNRKPGQLSGGQRQRVAIGRAIVREPRVFLFDEPLSNLDAALRVRMRIEIARLQKELRTTTIYVTHDQVEAMTLADRIVVLQGGRVEQVGTPISLYHQPANRFVAGFIGSPAMNFLPATLVDADYRSCAINVAGHRVSGIPRLGGMIGQSVTLGVRPEHLSLEPCEGLALDGQVESVERLGDITYLYLSLNGDTENLLTVAQKGDHALARGAAVRVHAPHTVLHLFDAGGQALQNTV
ncbi:MAG: sn-glycerol-3-phosphate ABC transporter ATP-binding protein UgpC [Thiothrix sp.]|nr:sn-glycerol-3-phosphate ABC transporter ATP-binding protein UgpC [Thiothrix sp.]HPQ96691.1 sn-glycerol-3-phosphate ABC transporter ATP-binding protein UgpC [Thiolinea sp.]